MKQWSLDARSGDHTNRLARRLQSNASHTLTWRVMNWERVSV